MKLPIVLDLETKEKFSNVNYDRKKLGVSLVGIYDYNSGICEAYTEKEFGKLFEILERCSYIIGFNVNSFDIPILQPYYPGDFSRFMVFDILDDIKDKVGRRLSLNYVAQATINKRKSGNGLLAIEYFKSGDQRALRKYCLDDVMLTKELFEYGVKHGEIFYMNQLNKTIIKVDWKKYLEPSERKESHLTLPF